MLGVVKEEVRACFALPKAEADKEGAGLPHVQHFLSPTGTGVHVLRRSWGIGACERVVLLQVLVQVAHIDSPVVVAHLARSTGSAPR